MLIFKISFGILSTHVTSLGTSSLERVSKCNCHNRLDIEAGQFKSVYFTPDSFREAKAAASSLCNLVSRIASGKLDNGFAVIRPPGHHAEPSGALSVCPF